MEKPVRKVPRLKAYDYSKTGAYFITVCTKDRKNYFWDNVGAIIGRPPKEHLTQCGKIVDDAINHIPVKYPSIKLKAYVIMPDHIHLLLLIQADECGRPMIAPTVSRVVNQMKGYVTKQIGESIWQKSFYDHVIRNNDDYIECWRYIRDNPKRWVLKNEKNKEDCFE